MPHTYSLQWLLQSTDLQNFEVLSWQIFQLPGRFHNRAPMVPQALVVPRKLQEVIPKSFKVIAHTQKKKTTYFTNQAVWEEVKIANMDQAIGDKAPRLPPSGLGRILEFAMTCFTLFLHFLFIGANLRICHELFHYIFLISSAHIFCFNHTFLFGRYIRGLQMGTGPWIKSELSKKVIKTIWPIMKSYKVQLTVYQDNLNEVI